MTDGDIYGIAGIPSVDNTDLALRFILKDVFIVRAYQQRLSTLQNEAMFALYYESHL